MLRSLGVGIMLFGIATSQAQAQYYPPQDGGPRDQGPPPGYAPPPPGYPPPEGYPPRAEGYGYGRPGGRCDAFLRTPYGPRHVVCPMGRPKPVDADCACPPRDGYGPPAHGHVIP